MNLFDTSTFEINENIELNVQEIGNSLSRIVTVDNFFKYPERILEFTDKMIQNDNIQSDPQKVQGFYPGYQTYFMHDVSHLFDFVRFHVGSVFGAGIRGLHTSYQSIDGNKKVYAQCNRPHTDSGLIAGNIFLSETVEKGSGTRFYRNKLTKEESTFANNCRYRRERYASTDPDLSLVNFEPIIEDDLFESYFLAEEKFNRLNMYEGALFHAAFIEPNTYTSHLRKSISFLTQS